MRKLKLLFFLVLIISVVTAKEYHVSVNGSDKNDGSASRPYKTISAAAEVAQPGDVIIVHAGTYRERINPPRGGASEMKRIVYEAASGEKVVIKGSEIVRNWVKVQDDTWKVTLPNSFFGRFNPYSDLIHGDWFDPKGRQHHTGAVYLNGEWLTEAGKHDAVLQPAGDNPLWYGQADQTKTTIWAQFKGMNPNEQLVEINVRQTVFYPEKAGMNYITVRGFTLRDAATPWAPPTAEQIGLIGTNWSKGWIIENNVFSHSVCSGIALGKYGDQWDNKSANSAEGYVNTIELALKNGWNKETIGHHIVRNNTISHCEQAGIVGSLGAAFSTVTGNTIHDIHVRQLFGGAEMAGIKFHGAIDVEISRNRIYRTSLGIWMDWMAQGTHITSNLCYNNIRDLFCEVNHGPYLVDNNIFLSEAGLWDVSEGGAYVHNLVTGKIMRNPDGRITPYHLPHSTEVVTLKNILGGDGRFYNNIFVSGYDKTPLRDDPTAARRIGYGLEIYNNAELPMQVDGNVYYKGAKHYIKETNYVEQAGFDPQIKITEEDENVYLHITLDKSYETLKCTFVTPQLLGKALIPSQAYENQDGSPLKIDTDYFGKKRNKKNPSAGPFENPGNGILKLKVWDNHLK